MAWWDSLLAKEKKAKELREGLITRYKSQQGLAKTPTSTSLWDRPKSQPTFADTLGTQLRSAGYTPQQFTGAVGGTIKEATPASWEREPAPPKRLPQKTPIQPFQTAPQAPTSPLQGLTDTIDNWLRGGQQAAGQIVQAFQQPGPFGAAPVGAAPVQEPKMPQGPTQPPEQPNWWERTVTPWVEETAKPWLQETFGQGEAAPQPAVGDEKKPGFWPWETPEGEGFRMPWEKEPTPTEGERITPAHREPGAMGLWQDLNRFDQLEPQGQAQTATQLAEGIASNTLKDASGRDLWPELISKNPDLHLNTSFQMVLNDTARPDITEKLDSEQMVTLAYSARDQGALDNLDISENYLTNLVRDDEWSYSSLHDMGYKSQDFLQQTQNSWIDSGAAFPFPVSFDQSDLQGLSYGDIKALTGKLDYWHDNPEYLDYWKRQGVVRMELELSEAGFDDKGNPVYRASWRQVVDPRVVDEIRQKEGDKEWTREKERYERWYWSQQQVNNRRKQREESWQWEHEKGLEGWAEYYSALDTLRLIPMANEYFESPTRFNALRRKWETQGGGQSWVAYLQGYDFKNEYADITYRERMGTAARMAPRMRGVSFG